MSHQQAEIHQERMQRTLAALERLWWLPETDDEAVLWLASECGLKSEFSQCINKLEKRYA